MSIFPANFVQDDKGRFIKRKLTLIPLSDKLKDAIFGNLLGDGHLRFTKKDKNRNPTGNAHYVMTLKDLDYAKFL
jgi:hypothetical protein